MNRLIAFLTIAMILIEAGFFYPSTGIIVEIDEDNNTFLVEDYNGQLWEVEGIEDFLLGDVVSMLMYSFGTQKVVDDEVIVVHASGWNMYDIQPWEGTAPWEGGDN